MQTSSKLLWAGSLSIMSILGAIGSFSSNSSSIQVNQIDHSPHRPTLFRGSGRMKAMAEPVKPANRGSGRMTAQDDRGSGRFVAGLNITETNYWYVTSIKANEQDRGSGRLTAYASEDQQNIAFRGSGRVTSDAQTAMAKSLI
ncbi:MAG: hypothetical protein AAF215_15450 [Cyanobacteria bacterium P01_A01_bin.123]